MKLLILLSTMLSLNTLAQRPNVIYGEDGRVDVVKSNDPLFRKLSRSTVALMKIGDGIVQDGDNYKLNSETFGSSMRVCPEERFSKQMNPAYCSGFLVGDDLIMTAGHCVTNQRRCESTAFVFDFKLDKDGSVNTSPLKENVYHCDRIISSEYTNEVDYAVIQLRRKVTNRIPLIMNKDKNLKTGTKLLVIGHPAGLPTKIADGAIVRPSNDRGYFVANLDTYGGNSGSAVFNHKTAEVEGILVRGETDYVRAPGRSCRVSFVCEDNECRGEDSTRLNIIPDFDKILLNQKRFYKKRPKAKKYAAKTYSLRKKKRPYYRSKKYYVKSYK